MGVPKFQTPQSLAICLALVLLWVAFPPGAGAAEDGEAPTEADPRSATGATPEEPQSEHAHHIILHPPN